ncbi:MAG: potassium channel family protein [Acidobacteriota bacterium]
MNSRVERLWRLLKRENLIRLFLLVMVMLAISTLGLALVEPERTLPEAFWLSVVTMTTVGYGDVFPTTAAGRIIGMVMMFFGIGLLGMFSATVAGMLVERKLKEDRGMRAFTCKDHFILCQWNHRGRDIVQELRSDQRTSAVPIVLIAQLEMVPIDDENLFFVKGEVTEESLRRANLGEAKTVVILGDDHLEVAARDAKVVLSVLTVESLNPNVYTIVELMDGANAKHCERAHADEIIVASEFSSRLISRSALDHGISRIISELLSSRVGTDLYKVAVPAGLAGRPFLEVLTEVKRRKNATVLALQKGPAGALIPNPPVDAKVEETDFLIIIAEEEIESLPAA